MVHHCLLCFISDNERVWCVSECTVDLITCGNATTEVSCGLMTSSTQQLWGFPNRNTFSSSELLAFLSGTDGLGPCLFSSFLSVAQGEDSVQKCRRVDNTVHY